MKLPASFYQGEDVIGIARSLLGKYLYTNINGNLAGGMIVETEAYKGPDDRGSHAWNNRRTTRNEAMYSAGGVVYMYICYGIHDMVNVVTGTQDTSHAILIRAIEPLEGIEHMRQRRNLFSNDMRLCQGPGALAAALGLNKSHNGLPLSGDTVWIEDRSRAVPDGVIAASPRIGMNFDGPYKTIPWRFYIRGNKFVSRNKN